MANKAWRREATNPEDGLYCNHPLRLPFHGVEFQNFSITQILRKSAKTAVFAIFGGLNLVNLVNFSLQIVQ